MVKKKAKATSVVKKAKATSQVKKKATPVKKKAKATPQVEKANLKGKLMTPPKRLNKKGVGKPTNLSERMMLQIFDWVADGMKLQDVATKLGVSPPTISRWQIVHPNFKKLMDDALEIKAHVFIDDLIEIADDDSKDLIIDEDGVAKPNVANVARSRLRIAARTKVAAFYSPRVFGDRAQDHNTISIKSNGDAVFMGLMIIPPTEDGDPIKDIDNIIEIEKAKATPQEEKAKKDKDE